MLALQIYVKETGNWICPIILVYCLESEVFLKNTREFSEYDSVVDWKVDKFVS